MQQTVGAIAALFLLLLLIVGPIFLAVSAPEADEPGIGSALCPANDLACEMGTPPGPGAGR